MSSPLELLNYICSEKNTIEPAAKQFKPDERTLHTSFVPLPSNQVQNPQQLVPESISVIPSNFRPRKSLKIERPIKKSAEQNNEPIQNSDSAQPATRPRNLISLEATPPALEELPCKPQSPTKTKPSKSKRKRKNKKLKRHCKNKILKSVISFKALVQYPLYARLGSVQDIFNFYYDKMFRDLVNKILTKIIQKQKQPI